MGRAVYPHELTDPDFSWLISRYQENNPNCLIVECTSLPLVLIKNVPVTSPDSTVGLLPVPPSKELKDTQEKFSK